MIILINFVESKVIRILDALFFLWKINKFLEFLLSWIVLSFIFLLLSTPNFVKILIKFYYLWISIITPAYNKITVSLKYFPSLQFVYLILVTWFHSYTHCKFWISLRHQTKSGYFGCWRPCFLLSKLWLKMTPHFRFWIIIGSVIIEATCYSFILYGKIHNN